MDVCYAWWWMLVCMPVPEEVIRFLETEVRDGFKLMRMPGTELRFPARATSALNQWGISSAHVSRCFFLRDLFMYIMHMGISSVR